MTPVTPTRRWSPGRLLIIDSGRISDPNLHTILRHPKDSILRGTNTRPGRQRSRKSRSVARLTLTPGSSVYLKHFYPKNLWRFLISLFLPSRAQNSFQIHQRLLESDLPVPRPVASVDCRRGLFYESFLLIEEIPGTQPIRDFVIENCDFLEKNPTFREKLFTNVGHLVRSFHDHHFFHVDLSIKNILISVDSRDLDRTSLYLIDFDTCYSLAYLPDSLFAPFRWTDLRRLMDSLRYGLSPQAKRNVLDAYFSSEPFAAKKEANFLRFYRLTHRSDDPDYQPIPPHDYDRASSCADRN